MCHHNYEPSDWREAVEEHDEEEEPSFLNEDSDVEVELVTDGGDE
jgi:hypothetical protein